MAASSTYPPHHMGHLRGDRIPDRSPPRRSPPRVHHFGEKQKRLDSSLETALNEPLTRDLLFNFEQKLLDFMEEPVARLQLPYQLQSYHKTLMLRVAEQFNLQRRQSGKGAVVLEKTPKSRAPQMSLRQHWAQTQSRSHNRGHDAAGYSNHGIPRSPPLGSSGRTAPITRRHDPNDGSAGAPSAATAAPSRSSNGSYPHDTRGMGYSQHHSPVGLPPYYHSSPAYSPSNSHSYGYGQEPHGSYSNQSPYPSHSSYMNPYSAYSSHPQSKPGHPSHSELDYNNPYARNGYGHQNYTKADLNKWVQQNARKKTKQSRAKAAQKSRKNKRGGKEPPINLVDCPLIAGKPFESAYFAKYAETHKVPPSDKRQPQRKYNNNSRPRRENESHLPGHIIQLYDFDSEITLPEFHEPSDDSNSMVLKRLGRAKTPRDPLYYMCWDHASKKGCSRGPKCKWVHCSVGILNCKEDEFDPAFLNFASAHRAKIVWVNPAICLAVMQTPAAANKLLQKSEELPFKIRPYDKLAVEELTFSPGSVQEKAV